MLSNFYQLIVSVILIKVKHFVLDFSCNKMGVNKNAQALLAQFFLLKTIVCRRIGQALNKAA